MANQIFHRFLTTAAVAVTVALTLAGCSPALDWRETRPAGADMVLTLPCKPEHLTRPINLAGAGSALTMTGCASGSTTFVLGYADVADPRLVESALQQLRQTALDNLHGHLLASSPAAVAQSTPGLAAAQDLVIEGRDPAGVPLREHLLLFAQGRRVYQALTLGPAAGFQDDAAQTFTSSIRLSPPPQHP